MNYFTNVVLILGFVAAFYGLIVFIKITNAIRQKRYIAYQETQTKNQQNSNLYKTEIQGQELVGGTEQRYDELQQDVIALKTRLSELAKQIDIQSQRYEIPLNKDIEAELKMLVKENTAFSVIHYIQNLVYREIENLHREVIYTEKDESSPHSLILPADLKMLLEYLAEMNGFTSGTEYFENEIRAQARNVRQRKEAAAKDWEERFKDNRSTKIPVGDFVKSIPTTEKSSVNLRK